MKKWKKKHRIRNKRNIKHSKLITYTYMYVCMQYFDMYYSKHKHNHKHKCHAYSTGNHWIQPLEKIKIAFAYCCCIIWGFGLTDAEHLQWLAMSKHSFSSQPDLFFSLSRFFSRNRKILRETHTDAHCACDTFFRCFRFIFLCSVIMCFFKELNKNIKKSDDNSNGGGGGGKVWILNHTWNLNIHLSSQMALTKFKISY